MPRIIALCFALLAAATAQSQQYLPEIQTYLKTLAPKYRLNPADVQDWDVSSQYTHPKTGLTYTYLHQRHAGIRIFNAISPCILRNGEVVHFANRFHGQVDEKANATSPILTPEAAIAAAAGHLGISITNTPLLVKEEQNLNRKFYGESGISKHPIRVDLVYQPVGQSLRLAWDVNIAPRHSADWWNIRIDALTGEFLAQNNWTTHCDFGHPDKKGQAESLPETDTPKSITANGYNVYPLPVEAPTFGGRQVITTQGDPTASPYSWHDNNGAAGAEFTITRGNNVYAYEDVAAQDAPGTSPDGGSDLTFDFPLNLNNIPLLNQDAAVTNLFYLNNVAHDILYHYGFDEISGNYQDNNYGNGGQEDDYVLAEAQDGGGTNNANFSAPEDGYNGVMQMYIFSGNAGDPATFTVNSPLSIDGDYTAIEGSIGPTLATAITQDLVLVNDGTAPTTDACEPIQNGAALNGKIALIDRGTCTFVSKVQEAEANGAVAAIIINNQNTTPFAMGGTGFAGIPAFMISQSNGNLIKNAINAGNTVNTTLSPGLGNTPDLDCSFDNGILVHEYGHGVSVRLTGGPDNSSCLDNEEQAGEGWSDWLALLLTIEPDDQGPDPRGMATFAYNEAPDGNGIRRYKYSTDMNINPETYGYLTFSPESHDIGEIWAQTLWDLTWRLIDSEGFDSDWYNGTGGNNTVLRLVIEGMKFQPCSPGFIDGRDAILAADDVLYGGSHNCLIWQAFADRGMGEFADQGDNYYAGDETEDFTVPGGCEFVSAPDSKQNLSVNLYPNPAQKEVALVFNNREMENVSVEMVSVDGKLVRSFSFSGTAPQKRLNLDNIDGGIYLLNIKTPLGALVKKLVVME